MSKIARVESATKGSVLIRPRAQEILVIHVAEISMHNAVNVKASNAPIV